MNIVSITRFLHSIATLGNVVFGEQLSQTDWQVLIILGGAKSPAPRVVQRRSEVPGAQSYKTLKCLTALSDDALSRSLKRLVSMGLVVRCNGEVDQRQVLYALSEKAEQGFGRMGGMVVAELGGLVLSLGMNMSREQSWRDESDSSAG